MEKVLNIFGLKKFPAEGGAKDLTALAIEARAAPGEGDPKEFTTECKRIEGTEIGVFRLNRVRDNVI